MKACFTCTTLLLVAGIDARKLNSARALGIRSAAAAAAAAAVDWDGPEVFASFPCGIL